MYIMKDGNIEITKQHWKKDALAIFIAMNGAFWIGLLLGEGTLGLALVIGLISYIVIRYFQTKGLI
jgi:uncharacterized membrane protein YccC